MGDRRLYAAFLGITPQLFGGVGVSTIWEVLDSASRVLAAVDEARQNYDSGLPYERSGAF